MLKKAEEFIAMGWHVLPLKAKSKDPNFNLIKKAYLSASKDLDVIRGWFQKDPKANLGIAARQSGLVILDIDPRNGGEYLDIFNETYTVKTPDGWHLYYKSEAEAYKSPDKGIDVKYNGYVAAPPSIHPSGMQYKVINKIEPQPMSAQLKREVIK